MGKSQREKLLREFNNTCALLSMTLVDAFNTLAELAELTANASDVSAKPESTLTQDELAKRWKMARGTLSNWRVKGRGPKFLKQGKEVIYLLSEVERYEKQNLKSNTV